MRSPAAFNHATLIFSPSVFVRTPEPWYIRSNFSFRSNDKHNIHKSSKQTKQINTLRGGHIYLLSFYGNFIVQQLFLRLSSLFFTHFLFTCFLFLYIYIYIYIYIILLNSIFTLREWTCTCAMISLFSLSFYVCIHFLFICYVFVSL